MNASAQPPSWHALAALGRLAPSGHNTQPWLLRPTGDRTAELLYVPARLLPVEDTDGRFTAAFLGCFVEALNVAAAADGWRVELAAPAPAVDMRPGHEPRRFGELRLERGASTDLDASLLQRRRTSRLRYDGAAAQGALEQLAELVAAAGHEARFFTDAETVGWIVELNAKVLFYDLAEDERRREIGEWVRTSDRRARASGDGFSPSTLGFPPLLLRVFFRHYRLLRGPRRERWLRRVYLRSMHGTANVGWLKGRFGTPQECFDAGRMFLRFWLALTAHGLVLQPFGSVITNERSHAELVERVGESEGDEEVWLLFRLGRSDTPPASDRLATDAVVVG